jgi:integrase
LVCAGGGRDDAPAQQLGQRSPARVGPVSGPLPHSRRRAPGSDDVRTKREAEAVLATARADLERGTWIDPNAGRVPLVEYARRWLDERPQLRPRTRELYEAQLRRHILPTFGAIALRDLRRPAIRTWYASLLNEPRPGASTAAKCYRLLRSILATAVEDELIPKNPVAIKGAGVEHPKERPIATIEQVYAVADAIEPRYRALVLTATFTGLRLGELRALTRRRLDLLHATVHVTGQMQELKDGTLVVGPPKTAAGVRRVAIPLALSPSSRPTWPGGRLQGRTDSCSAVPGTSRCAERACTPRGGALCAPQTSTGFASTTCATRGTRWRPQPAQARGSS